MKMRTWMLSIYVMSKLKYYYGSHCLREWKSNFSHYLFKMGTSGNILLKDVETQTVAEQDEFTS